MNSSATPPGGLLLNPANLITLARLCAVPVAIFFVLRAAFAPAFAIFAAAGISDAIDGWLARRQGTTTLGAVLDPLADKALMISMYITLALMRILPDWLAILVVFRDILIIGGVVTLWMFAQPPHIAPFSISRANTFLQIALVGLALGTKAAHLDLPAFLSAMIVAVTISTLASGAAYVLAFFNRSPIG